MSTRSRQPASDLDEAIAHAEAERDALAAQLASRRTELPLRYWRQQAHFTTPAANATLARKAVEGGTSATASALERLGLKASDLAERLEVPVRPVERLLERPARAPLVMLDGEDAIAPGDEAAARGLAVAVDVLRTADWAGDEVPTLRFVRPPGFGAGHGIRDLYRLLWLLREQSLGDSFPLDGIVFPKVEHPEQVDVLNRLLTSAEERLGLRTGTIRVAYLIESGWAAVRLAEIAERAAPRLSALIFGLADFSADLALPTIANDHLLADWARAELIATAGAIGVPAIDGLSLVYPVADPALDLPRNRARWLDRMRLVYDDAVRSQELGMAGKWVGHPAQLFAVLLAYDRATTDEVLEREAAKLFAYEAVLTNGVGATMIDGVMSDRATDRHARVTLRRATAAGRFSPARAMALGVIDDDERGEAERAFSVTRNDWR